MQAPRLEVEDMDGVQCREVHLLLLGSNDAGEALHELLAAVLFEGGQVGQQVGLDDGGHVRLQRAQEQDHVESRFAHPDLLQRLRHFCLREHRIAHVLRQPAARSIGTSGQRKQLACALTTRHAFVG